MKGYLVHRRVFPRCVSESFHIDPWQYFQFGRMARYFSYYSLAIAMSVGVAITLADTRMKFCRFNLARLPSEVGLTLDYDARLDVGIFLKVAYD